MTEGDSRRTVSPPGPSTVEEVLMACRGDGKFVKLMKWAVGLAIGTDGIEVTLLSYLVPCVAAEWGLSSFQQGALTASVFAGELLGAIVMGVMSDAYGRRPMFKLATMFVLTFGILTTIASDFWWLLLFRTLVGVGAGGMEVPFDLLGEIVNFKEKSMILVDVQVAWAIGSLFVGVAAWAILSFGYSWRLLALIAALPPLAVRFCFRFVPESPRWLIANGREEEAKVVLRKIAKINGLELTDVTIVSEEKLKDKGGGSGILSLWRRPELRRRSTVSCTIWASFGFLYYGVILLSSKIMGVSEECSFDYSILFFAASSELVANVISRLYVTRIDRRLSLTVNFALSGLMILLMPLNGSMAWLLATSFFARGMSYVAACFSWVITPELYPTEIRSTGHAVSNAFARVGAVVASFWVASPASNLGIAAGLFAVGVMAALVAQALPRNRHPEWEDDSRGGVGGVGEVDEGEYEPLLSDPLTKDRRRQGGGGGGGGVPGRGEWSGASSRIGVADSRTLPGLSP